MASAGEVHLAPVRQLDQGGRLRRSHRRKQQDGAREHRNQTTTDYNRHPRRER